MSDKLQNWNDVLEWERNNPKPVAPVDRCGKDSFRLTGDGLMWVLKMLTDLGFWQEPPAEIMANFAPNKFYAGVLGTYMTEAAEQFLAATDHWPDSDKDSSEQCDIVLLVALFSGQAKAETRPI